MKEQAQQGRRHEGNGEVDHETAGGLFARQAGQHVDQLRPIFPAHGQDGAELNHDFEQLSALVVELQQAPDHDQVAGARDGKKFGEAFDDAQNERFDDEDEIHALVSRRKKSGGLGPARSEIVTHPQI